MEVVEEEREVDCAATEAVKAASVRERDKEATWRARSNNHNDNRQSSKEFRQKSKITNVTNEQDERGPRTGHRRGEATQERAVEQKNKQTKTNFGKSKGKPARTKEAHRHRILSLSRNNVRYVNVCGYVWVVFSRRPRRGWKKLVSST